MKDEVKPDAEPLETAPAPVPEEPKSEVAAEPAPEPEKTIESAPAEPEAKPEELKPEDEPTEPQAVPTEQPQDNREEFARMVQDFGAEVAAEVFTSGGDYNAAMKMAFERVKKENEALRKDLNKPRGGKPLGFVARTGMSKAEAESAYSEIRDPVERARFRDAHKAELGLK